jgi:hypothetical protein
MEVAQIGRLLVHGFLTARRASAFIPFQITLTIRVRIGGIRHRVRAALAIGCAGLALLRKQALLLTSCLVCLERAGCLAHFPAAHHRPLASAAAAFFLAISGLAFLGRRFPFVLRLVFLVQALQVVVLALAFVEFFPLRDDRLALHLRESLDIRLIGGVLELPLHRIQRPGVVRAWRTHVDVGLRHGTGIDVVVSGAGED